ncbi:MAG: hypothetical protein ACT4O9_07115 [Blastocatellia bacterium]
MSDFLIVDSSGGNPYQTTEHYLRRVLVGDMESVRARIVSVLERLGYDVIDDDNAIVRGRRGAAGWGIYYSSADVLDYPRTLVVKLKPSGDHATRVTFDYVIKHPSLSKGEKEILTREAEAISSLANVRKREKICAACGTESTDDSRFCRRCGTPMTVQSVELELLNMAAEIRAGYTSVVASEIVMVASIAITGAALIAALATGVDFGKGLGTLLIIGMALAVLNIFFIAFGWNRMSRSLKSKPKAETGASEQHFHLPPTSDKFLSDSPVMPHSVIEGTTSLLEQDFRRTATIELIKQKPGKDTLS